MCIGDLFIRIVSGHGAKSFQIERRDTTSISSMIFYHKMLPISDKASTRNKDAGQKAKLTECDKTNIICQVGIMPGRGKGLR